MSFIAEFTLEEILPLLGKTMPSVWLKTPAGLVKAKTSTPRLCCLKNNQACVSCGKTGNTFILEGNLHEPPKGQRRCFIENCDWCTTLSWRRNNNPGTAPHLNLYYRSEAGLLLMTQDHIIPKSRGGSKNSQSNLQTMCTNCNQKKGDMSPHEWLAYRFRNSPTMDVGSIREQRLHALELYADELARTQKRAA